MNSKSTLSAGILPMFLAVSLVLPAAGAEAVPYEIQPVEDRMPDSLSIKETAPTNTLQGTRGLTQTPSGETLGAGRLVLGLNGPWYRQEKNFTGVPNQKADIFTGIGNIAYGMNPFIDVYASLTGFSSLNYNSSEATGLGSWGAGAQVSVPLPESWPIAIAAQYSIFDGISRNQINENNADGYNYFETRTRMDFRGLFIQSLVFGPEQYGFKVHFNEGLATSMQDTPNLLLLAAGLQTNFYAAALGLEIHSRTSTKDVALLDDPLWITPSVQYRTGYNVNLTAGADVALSRDRKEGVAERSLEPWRLIGGINFTFDTRFESRRDAKWAVIKAEREKERLAALKLERERAAEREAETARVAEAERQRLAAEEAAKKAQQVAQAPVAAAPVEPQRSDLETRILSGQTLALEAVPFDVGSSQVSEGAKPFLSELAKTLVRFPKLRYEVGGHTDDVGDEKFNQKLSQTRAASIKSYLVAQEPTLKRRVGAKGYGERNPKADNATEAGRILNRKADVQVVNKPEIAQYLKPAAAPAPTALGPEDQ